jgi:hypothetical protein
VSWQLHASVINSSSVIYRNITLQEGDNEITLNCEITGFESNIPDVMQTWKKNGNELNAVPEKYEVLSMSKNPEKMSLKIKNPGK